MELSQETDAEALWQDAMDLLGGRELPESVLAMLRNCTPKSLGGGVLVVETPMRLVLKTVTKNASVVEECLSQAAFEPVRLEVRFAPARAAKAEEPQGASSTMSREEAMRWMAETSPSRTAPKRARIIEEDTWDEREAGERARALKRERRLKNPLVDHIPEASSKLTFERFVRGEENNIAFQAAQQVANGINTTYNPLFIYGKSGLGKTHLLCAIQNYVAQNDATRLCVYRDAASFTTDYTTAMRHPEHSAAAELRRNYADIDVLIIDDIQQLMGRSGTIDFFFDTFNELLAAGKQIVLAADRTPAQLGLGKNAFDERVTSRLGAGFVAPIQVPSYELKLNLIETFCERMRDDARREGVPGLTGSVPAQAREYMAKLAGTNIRVIEGFCQRCLFAATTAEQQGREVSTQEIEDIARECWPTNKKAISIEDVQRAVERSYDIDHAGLVGNKRTKNLMEPRHVAIWLCRELGDYTFAEIGKHFGGRTHATIMHSIEVVDKAKREDKLFYDRVMQLRDSITRDS